MLFHIGYHKTATSYIQKNVFEGFPDVFCRVNQRVIFDQLIYPNYFSFEKSLEHVKGFVSECSLKASQSGRLVVFSSERLSGGPHSGGFDSADIANRIKSVCPRARIFVVIREQNSLIYSSYNQYIKAVGSYSLEEYLQPSTLKNKDLFHFDFFEFHHLIGYYQSLFGKDNVLVLPNEMLARNHDDFIRRMLQFSGLLPEQGENIMQSMKRSWVNESLNPLIISLKRIFNPFVLRGHKNLGRLWNSTLIERVYKLLVWLVLKLNFKKISKRLSDKRKVYINDVVKDRYRESNRKTSKLIGIDLAQYGYKC